MTVCALATVGATAIIVVPQVCSRAAQAQGSDADVAAPTFYRDVVPILQQHCQSCHRAGEIAPTSLVTYAETKPQAQAVAIAARNHAMPPWFADPSVGHFANDPSLSPKEISMLKAWADGGAPAGDPNDAPPPRKWANGWNIPQPDLVVTMPKAVALPADGDVDYTYEIVPSGFTEDKWVQMSEVRPLSRANVHHAVVYIRPPDSKWLRHAPVGVPFTASDMTDEADRRDAHWTDSDILLVYAPGSSPDTWPAGFAKFVPAGSDFIFQMHYTTHGKPASDRTSVGLVFAKATPAKRVITLQLTNDHFVIPPGADDFRVEARGTLPNDALLLSFLPHMHLRGKQFDYNIVRADGSVEPLLRVHWNFCWQMSYKLAEPLALKAGTELQAVALYDNSRNNPHNPDPDAAVRWGDQTDDEMMVGFFDVAVAPNLDKREYFIRHTDPAAHK
jgi:Copper type II ascorbate-dependent monooxygenase, C-terminal domain